MQQIRLLLVSEFWTLLVIHLPISASFPLDLPSSLAWLHASWSALLDSFYFMLPNTGKEYNYVIFLYNTFYLHYISVGQRPSLKDIHDVPPHFCPYALLVSFVAIHFSHIVLDLSTLYQLYFFSHNHVSFLPPLDGTILLFHPLYPVAFKNILRNISCGLTVTLLNKIYSPVGCSKIVNACNFHYCVCLGQFIALKEILITSFPPP